MKADFIVCGTIRADDSSEGRCSTCDAVVYPTIGTLAFAQREEIPLVCVDCWRKLPEYQFGGFMHHGKMVTRETR